MGAKGFPAQAGGCAQIATGSGLRLEGERVETQNARNQNVRLKAARKAAGFKSAGEAARVNKWNESTYRGHESGPREISKDAAIQYSRAFGVTVSLLLTGQEDEASEYSLRGSGGLDGGANQTRGTSILHEAVGVRVVPLVGPDSFDEMAEGKIHRLNDVAGRFVSVAGAGFSSRTFAYELLDDAMRGERFSHIPDLCKGDVLLVDMNATPEPGRIVLAGVRATRAVVARVYGLMSNETEDDVLYTLSTKSKLFPETQKYRKNELSFRYRVLAVQRML